MLNMKTVSFAHHDMGKWRDLGPAAHDVSDGGGGAGDRLQRASLEMKVQLCAQQLPGLLEKVRRPCLAKGGCRRKDSWSHLYWSSAKCPVSEELTLFGLHFQCPCKRRNRTRPAKCSSEGA